jgi:8-oxo-dGTP pyrophosphatase MutT (NUDIX family)
MTTPTPRVGARLLLIDADDRVLLIHERYDDAGSTHWLTPGGGVEGDESLPVAAAREAYEETGIAVQLPVDAPSVLVTQRLWSWRHLHFDQTDHFFLARVPSGLDVVPQGLTEVESQTLLGHRWWALDELRATDEVILPGELADVLATLVE